MKILLASCLIFLLHLHVSAQTIRPDLHKADLWETSNREVQTVTDGGKKAVKFNVNEKEGFMILKDYNFTNGTIEFDVKGKNVLQQSFVGVTFHFQDTKTQDVVYFRPFNFMNADTVRRPRSVQYASMPDYPWPKLRESFPGKYENKVNPVPNPDGWFHVKIIVAGKAIKVYVDHSPKPSLEVESLSKFTTGKIGLWAGPMSDPSFANFEITP
ncbi:family 16 glycoside hydrolase [Dyadobacter aurulentus]|uniref:family 16 glycoside hydrolase n=1 Tax=Dyadobacter sp. UC 10 TaxID=2605428 RepID=UPI0011F29A4F|nr:family 16 glycoside hydrolase [Dyadobacter sp. UC 10]KAA0990069.1 DUF1080 domain-containing protein [Dyadobacter sp. UC 10]